MSIKKKSKDAGKAVENRAAENKAGVEAADESVGKAAENKVAPALAQKEWRVCAHLSDRGQKIAQPGDIVVLPEHLADHYLKTAPGSIELIRD
ncbi:MAG: hypothetical protein GY854_02305 [Deltaproteobacteria bacterium]|nr:hypothetical protein [Deltaproteobacteria bacterium]